MKTNLNKSEEQLMFDKLFITEICNDLARRGEVSNGEMSKADTLLKDWSRELRNKCRTIFPATRLKKVFAEKVGIRNW